MVAADTAELLEGGSALIVGVVAPGGEPVATRGWGLTLVPGGTLRARLLLADDDAEALGHLGAGARVAITAADVPTLRSVQIKGRSRGLQPATGDDRVRAAGYVEAFFGDIVANDGTPRAVLDRVVPRGYVACDVVVDEVFDQTPGPGAGAPLAGEGA
ncbi:MAG TPA: hypothetical protein VFZ77_07240 [Acidimicrobiales bacterium]